MCSRCTDDSITHLGLVLPDKTTIQYAISCKSAEQATGVQVIHNPRLKEIYMFLYLLMVTSTKKSHIHRI